MKYLLEKRIASVFVFVCFFLSELQDELWNNSEALYTMNIKSKGTTQKQQRICGYAIQLCGPLCMFFDEDIYALDDLKIVLRLVHLCKSVEHSSKLKTPSLCIS